MTESPITVFDCCVFLQALMSKSGPAVRCMELVETNRIRLVMSEEILTEIKDVISRLALVLMNPHLTDLKVENLIDMLLAKAEFVDQVPKRFSYPRDPNDEPYINLAIETKAAFIVSRDNDLLKLMSDHSEDAKDFRRRFRRIKIVDPVEFLSIIAEKDLSIRP